MLCKYHATEGLKTDNLSDNPIACAVYIRFEPEIPLVYTFKLKKITDMRNLETIACNTDVDEMKKISSVEFNFSENVFSH